MPQDQFYPKALLEGLTRHFAGQPDAAGVAFDSAQVMLEAQIAERPADPRLHTGLGFSYAGLGRTREAITEGLRATELFPTSTDVEAGPVCVLDLAWIYSMVGEREAAIEQLDRCLSGPGVWSIDGLLRDPRMDLLRDHPRFQALVERHRRKDAGG